MSDSNNQTEKLVGIEVTKSGANAVCVDTDGRVIDSDRISFSADGGTLEALAAFIEDLKQKFGDFNKIGIAVPGLIDSRTKLVVYSTFIPEHENEDFFGELESKTGVKVSVENDANSAAYGEYKVGAGRGSKDMFYATLGTGVGGAFIIDGNIWRGAAGFAGEFGHISIKSDGLNLEGVASAAGIVKRTKSRFHQDDTSSLSKIGEQEITLKDVVNAANDQDDFARMMLERTGNYVGTAIASVINLLNIERIVIGGPVMNAEKVVLDAIYSRAKSMSFKPSFESTQIVSGELGDNAGAIGAALLTLDQ